VSSEPGRTRDKASREDQESEDRQYFLKAMVVSLYFVARFHVEATQASLTLYFCFLVLS